MKLHLKHIAFVAIIALFSLTTQSCNSVKPIDKASLEGQWTLTSLNGKTASSLFKGALPNINFDIANNHISGNAGCNLYNGSFSINEKNEFSAPQIASTMMLCMEENEETLFLEELGKKNNILSISNDSVLTFSQDGKVVLEFQKVTESNSKTSAVLPKALYGAWTLTSMTDEDINKLFGETMPTIEFSEDGKAFGNSGCNRYNTNYEVSNDTISFGMLMSTKMACPNLEGESKYSSVLSTPSEVAIKGDTLILLKNKMQILEFKKITN